MIEILKWALVCSPFIHFLFIGKPILSSQALLSISLELAVILFFLTGKHKRKPDVKPALLFFSYIIANSLFLMGKGYLYNLGINSILLPFIHVSIFFLFYISLCNIIDENDYLNITKVIIYPAVILSLYAYFQYFKIDMFRFTGEWLDGVLGNPTNNAMYLAACLPFVFLHKRPLIPSIIIVVAILLFNSASAFIGAVFIIYSYLIVKRKYLIVGISTIVCIIICIFLYKYVQQFFNPYEKLLAWKYLIDSWKNNYIFGCGLDTFKNLKIIINYSQWHYTHNHYLWILHSLGVVGLILFFNWVGKLKYILRADDIRFLATLSLLSVGIMAMVSVPMRVYPIVLLTGLNLAILTKEKAV